MVLAVGNIDFYPHFSGTFIISMIILIKALRVGIGYFDIGTWFLREKAAVLTNSQCLSREVGDEWRGESSEAIA